MTETIVIAEFYVRGRSQVLLERYKGDKDAFRVSTVKRTTADKAAQLFLDEIPQTKKEIYQELIKQNMKRDEAGKVLLSPRPQAKKTPLKPPKAKKGTSTNAKSKPAGA